MNIKKVNAVFLFWPDYGMILEGKMSYLKIGKQQHQNIKNFGIKDYEVFLNAYWNISRGCAYFFFIWYSFLNRASLPNSSQQVPRPWIEPRTPGMTSRHSTPQLQSMDKSSVWKLNWCPVSLNLHPQESHNFDMSVLDCSGTGPLISQFLVSVISSKSQVT